MEFMVQRVEFLAASPGQSKSGEPTVILTIRPDRDSFRPHDLLEHESSVAEPDQG